MIKIAILLAAFGAIAAQTTSAAQFKALSAHSRCKGVKWNGCCTKANPCGEGDGDCDHSGECAFGLKCGTNNCPWFRSGTDCCTKNLRCKGKVWNGCCTTKTPCGLGDGDCDHNGECAKGLVCGTNNCPVFGYGKDCCRKPTFKEHSVKTARCKGVKWDGCCTTKTPCGEGDGDCDHNGECAAGLKCGTNNCPWFKSGTDCCTK